MRKWIAEHRRIPARTGAFLMLLFGFAAIVCAFQAATAPGSGTGTTSVGWGIVRGIVMGILAALFGWASQKKDANGQHEDVDVPQLVVTALVGALLGGFAAWKHMSLADTENLPILGTIIMAAEMALKIVWRNGKVSVQNALGTVKAGTDTKNPTVVVPVVVPVPSVVVPAVVVPVQDPTVPPKPQ